MKSLKILLFIALCAGAASAFAQSVSTGSAPAFPTKPIRFVVGFPPGGGNDLIARLVGLKMQQAWGQPVVIENKTGANSIIASEYVAKSPPDGYTLLVNATGGMSVNPVLYPKLSYDTLKDFIPLTMLGRFPLVVVANPSLPANSIQELIALAKARPGTLNYGAGSTAFQVATEMFKQMTGTDIHHIPYKGSIQAINAVIAGDVQLTFVDSPPALPHMQSKQLKALAVTSAERSASAPGVPTLIESGVAGYDMSLWIGLFAPRATQSEIASRLSGEAMRIVRLPDVKERFAAMGVDAVGNSSEQFTAIIRDEIAKFGQVARNSDIRTD